VQGDGGGGGSNPFLSPSAGTVPPPSTFIRLAAYSRPLTAINSLCGTIPTRLRSVLSSMGMVPHRLVTICRVLPKLPPIHPVERLPLGAPSAPERRFVPTGRCCGVRLLAARRARAVPGAAAQDHRAHAAAQGRGRGSARGGGGCGATHPLGQPGTHPQRTLTQTQTLTLTLTPTLPRKAVAVAAHAAVAAVARPIRWASQVPTLRTGPAQQWSSGAPLGDTRVPARYPP
jgi:hypothetical protein